MSRDIFHLPRLLRAPSNLALNPAREGAATASLGSLGQGLITLTVKNFFLISNLNLPSCSLDCRLARTWTDEAVTSHAEQLLLLAPLYKPGTQNWPVAVLLA